MHKLTKRVPRGSKIAVVEIRANVPVGRVSQGLDPKAQQLLAGTFQETGLSWNQVATYSLAFTGGVASKTARTELSVLASQGFTIVVAIGAEATKLLCGTSKPLGKYAGSLTWSEEFGVWVLPTHHPSVIYIGPRETMNTRYDLFDFTWDHVHRAVKLVKGEIKFPPKGGHDIPWEWVGHNGEGWDPGTDEATVWAGYSETTASQISRATEILSKWIYKLDSGVVVKFALDTESWNLNTFDPLLMIQVYDGEKAWAFNWGTIEATRELWELFLNHVNARWIIQNTKYDRQVLKRWLSVDLGERDIDTMILAMGITEKGKQCGLKYLSRQHLNAPFYEEELDVWLDKANICYGHIKPEVLAEYGCKDVYYAYHLVPILLPMVKSEGTEKSVRETLTPAQRVLADVEYQGMRVDVEYAKKTSAEWLPVIDAAIEKVQDYARSAGFPGDSAITAGQSYKSVCECVSVRARFHLEGLRCTSFAKRLRDQAIEVADCGVCANKRYVTKNENLLNVNSSKQMQHLCFDILKMKELPSEGRSCGKEFWKFNGNHEFAKLVAGYKELLYLRRNFLEGVQQYIAEDGKVHPDFLLFGTKTGRLAIHNPAMQTVPTHGENAKAAKKLFIADDEESVIVNADYKSLEMFIAHHLTGDPVLLDNLLGEWDVHTALAAKCYQIDPADVTPEERQSVKPVNFGAGYGISGFKLALDPAMEKATGGDADKAQEFIDEFWDMYAVWSAKCDEWRAQAHEDQFLFTEMGRKRRWNLITADNKNRVNNQAINFPGQSMASDLCLHSLIRLHTLLTGLGWGRILLTVHDSLVFNIKKKYLHQAITLIEKEMTTPPFKTDTPFAVDVTVGPSYGEQESYDSTKEYV